MNDNAVAEYASPAPTPRSETASYVALLERAAMDPAFDLDRLQRLIELKDKALADAARREFNEAMVAAQKRLPQIVRDAENTQTNSRYATIEAIGAAIDPIITEHGFFQSFSSADCPVSNCYRIVCKTAHVGGHEQIDQLDVPIDIAGIKGTQNKTATHALASTLSYGRRLLTMLVFNVKSRKALPDDDGNAAGGTVLLSAEQVADLDDKLAASGLDKAKFFAWLKIENFETVLAVDYDKIIARILQAAAHKQKAAGVA